MTWELRGNGKRKQKRGHLEDMPIDGTSTNIRYRRSSYVGGGWCRGGEGEGGEGEWSRLWWLGRDPLVQAVAEAVGVLVRRDARDAGQLGGVAHLGGVIVR